MAWLHNAAACSHNDNNIAKASSTPTSPSRNSLNGMFQQDSSAQWSKLWAISIPFIHYMCVIKARGHGRVQNDSETHSISVTWLHSWLCLLCSPVTQSRVFHFHFAHTHVFSLCALLILCWPCSMPEPFTDHIFQQHRLAFDWRCLPTNKTFTGGLRM